jgi:regulator of sigma E protease
LDFLGLLPSFGSFFFTLAAFVVALSIIVAVHEYGHYIVGKWSGIHADVFSLGFGPVLFSRVDKHGTRWQMAALPLGGYVKFAGDADAASAPDVEAMTGLDVAARRRTMQGAPLWARAATVAAGPAFNFIFSIIVFTLFMMVRGVAVDTPVVGNLAPLPTTSAGQGLLEGDLILSVDGVDTPSLEAFYSAISGITPAPNVTYMVERNGSTESVLGPYPQPPIAGSVTLQSAARDAGLQPGDVVISVDGVAIYAFEQLRAITSNSDGSPLSLQIWRAGEVIPMDLTPRSTDLPLAGGGFESRWLIGMSSGTIFEHPTRVPGVLDAAKMAVAQTWGVASTSVQGLYYMITGAISTCNITGPIGIAETSGAMASDGLADFIWFIAVLSVAVGLMNLFPIPILDGGHLVFHAWEAVTGSPPSAGAMRILMTAGLALLLSVMVFALTNDLFCP